MRARPLASVVLVLSAACATSPTAPSPTYSYALHIQPAATCASVWPTPPWPELFDIPLQVWATGLDLNLLYKSGDRPTDLRLQVRLVSEGTTFSGTVVGDYWTGTPGLILSISSFGSPGYVADARGTGGLVGTTTGTLNGRVAIFDFRAGSLNPVDTWIGCDSVEHGFTLTPVVSR